jgi:light-regulated signal transduction histidine kinase (bacteriophytochrome)
MGIESYIGVAVRGSAGRPIGLVVAMHDAPLVDTRNARRLMELFSVRVGTELERMDFVAAIGDLNATLEARVAERTRQLTLANEELEAFSYSVSHDLRAPVRHIAGFVEMLGEELGDSLADEPRRHLGIVADSARRMGQLVDDLLAFSRLGRVDLHAVPVDVAEVVDEARRDLAHETAGREIVWKIGALPRVKADRSLLRQVFLNLLSNAVKYTRPRTPAVIEVSAQRDPENAAQVVISVCDNGVGIDMKYAAKLFGVFQRLHGESEFEGTGIGLANVKRIVERHGGRVWVSGEKDTGAAFHVSLPLAGTVAA